MLSFSSSMVSLPVLNFQSLRTFCWPERSIPSVAVPGWIVLNYSLIQLNIFLMAWTSIERYLFIYHAHLIKQYFLFLHSIPIAVLYIFTPLLYIGLVIFYPCKSSYDVRVYLCGGSCYSSEESVGFYDWFGNGVVVQTTTLVVNVVLVIRHLIRRHRLKRVIISTNRRQQWVRNFSSFSLQLIHSIV